MRGKRLTRSNKASNAVESGNKSSDSWAGKHLSRRADETLTFVTTSTPAKQSTRTCNDTTLSGNYFLESYNSMLYVHN